MYAPVWVSAPQAHSKVSNINFDIWIFLFLWKGGSINIQWKIPNGKVLAHLGIKSKVLSRPLTDLSAWVGFWISSPEQGFKYQLWYLNIFLWRGVYKYPMKISERQSSKFLPTWVFPRPLTDLRACVRFCISSPQQGVNYQFCYLKIFCGGGVL